MDESLRTVEHIRTTLIDLGLRFGPKLLTALVILTLGVFVGRWVGKWTERALMHIEMEPPVRALLVRVARVMVFALFLILALQNLGVELLPLIAGLGVVGAGIALATQGVLSNLFAGLSIILTKPFRVGEYIGIVGEEGRVDSITLFQTTLAHPDRSVVVIPNRKIAGEILHNYGQIRQLDVAVGVAHDMDLNVVLATVDQILKASRHVLADLPPVVGATLRADSSVTIAIKPWVPVADFGTASAEINRAVLEAFRSKGILTPVPRHEVRLINAA